MGPSGTHPDEEDTAVAGRGLLQVPPRLDRPFVSLRQSAAARGRRRRESEAGEVADVTDIAPADTVLVQDSVKAFSQVFGRNPGGLAADRGFDEETNHEWLDPEKIYDRICPKSPRIHALRMSDERLAQASPDRDRGQGGPLQERLSRQAPAEQRVPESRARNRLGRSGLWPLGDCPFAESARTNRGTETGSLRRPS